MKKEAIIPVPDVSEILSDTSANYNSIVSNIARMNSAVPVKLEEDETNTNMLLVIKRYVNNLPNTKLILNEADLIQVHKLVNISDNVTNSTLLRLTELLKIKWEVRMINPNHKLYLRCDGDDLYNNGEKIDADVTLDTMMLVMLKYVVDNYGEMDLRLNTEYIQPYTVNNILTAIRYKRKISSYIFEKFCKLWGISYSYTITSYVDNSVSQTIMLDPSGWM